MKKKLVQFSYEIDLQPGEKLSLPPALADKVRAGRWLLTLRPLRSTIPIRNHNAFLSGYAPQDEGLYDDDSAR